MNLSFKNPWIEVLGVTTAILFVSKIASLFLPPSWIAFLVPTLLLYIPFFLLTFLKEPLPFIDRHFKDFLRGFFVFFLTTFIIFPPYLFFAHLWMLYVFDFQNFHPASLRTLLAPFLYQLLVVALPEEFFFRGYFQGRLKKVCPPRWRILGASLGWEWIVTAVVFTIAHSVLQLKWWHFSIFFPALLFGYLKERTGSITAPILFHAFCNSFMNWFAKSYF